MTRNPRPHDTTIRTIICYSAMASCLPKLHYSTLDRVGSIKSIDLIDIDLID